MSTTCIVYNKTFLQDSSDQLHEKFNAGFLRPKQVEMHVRLQ